jgi:hypothetical protein
VSPASNGDPIKPSVGSPRPDRPGQSSDLPSKTQHSPPTTVDRPPPQSPPPTPPTKQMPPSSESVSSPSSSRKDHTRSPPIKSTSDPEAEKSAKKGHNVLVRTLWGFIMIGGFLGQHYLIVQNGLLANMHLPRVPAYGSHLLDHPCFSMPDSCLS